MEKIVHNETTPWGVSKTILIEGGAGKVCASIDNDSPGVVYISDLAVIPSRRSQGLGKILLREAMAAFVGEQDFDKYKLHANTEGFARDWYRREGFVETGETRFNGVEVEMVRPRFTGDEVVFEAEFARYLRENGIKIAKDETLEVGDLPFTSVDLVNALDYFAKWGRDRLLAVAYHAQVGGFFGVDHVEIATHIPGAKQREEVYIIRKEDVK